MLENDVYIQNLLNRIHIGSYSRYRLLRLVFQGITFLISILFLGFIVVAPLDILGHAAKTQQFFEFFITIGGIVTIFILNLYWFFYRYFTLKQILKYNPKLYIPIFTQTASADDETEKGNKDKYKLLLINPYVYSLTLENFDLMPKLQYYFNYNKNKIVFNKGISPPKKSFDNFKTYNNYNHLDHAEVEIEKKNLQDMLPFLTNYSSVIEAFSQDLKVYTLGGQNPLYWRMKVFNEMNLFDKAGLTYLEYLKIISFECKKYDVNTNNFEFKRFITLYNSLKFGNRTSTLINVSESNFVTFMSMVIKFYKIKQDLDEAKFKYNYMNKTGSSQLFNRNKDSFLQEDMFLLSQSNNKLSKYKQDSSSKDSMSDGSTGYGHSESHESNSSENLPMFDLDYSDDNEDSEDLEQNDNIRSLSMRRINLTSSNASRPTLDAKLSDIKLQPIKKKK